MSGPLNEDTDISDDRTSYEEEGAPAGQRLGRSRHSRFVSAMKIVLPLGAIALLTTVLFYSGIFDSRDRLDVSFREIATLNNDLRMVSPRITGLDKSGLPYLLTADTATQAKDKPSHIALDNVQADLKLSGDTDWVSLLSTGGTLDTETEVLDLHQKIDIYMSSGYEFHGTSARIDFRQGTVASDATVEGHGPLGTLRADRMTADSGERKMRFIGHVKVRIYAK